MKQLTFICFLIFLALMLSSCAKFHAVNEPEEATQPAPITFPTIPPVPVSVDSDSDDDDDEHNHHDHDENGHCKHRKEHNRHGHTKHGRCLHND